MKRWALAIGLFWACTPASEIPKPRSEPATPPSLTIPPPVTSASAVAPPPSNAKPDSRTRAAFGMLLRLRAGAYLLQTVDPNTTKNGCPSSMLSVTFAVAKTDPWDSDFAMRCTPSSGPYKATIEIGSAGPDRKMGTADDLWTDHPIIDATRGCETACARAKECSREKNGTKIADRICAGACTKDTTEVNFYADTCALLDSCGAVVTCLERALDGNASDVDCATFGRVAASALGKKQSEAALVKECEKDVLWAHELACVRDAKTAHDLSLCFLTVNRANVEKILTSAP